MSTGQRSAALADGLPRPPPPPSHWLEGWRLFSCMASAPSNPPPPPPLSTRLQELPPVTAAAVVPSVNPDLLGSGSSAPGGAPTADSAGGPQHCITIDALRACRTRGSDAQHGDEEAWPFCGGEPAFSAAVAAERSASGLDTPCSTRSAPTHAPHLADRHGGAASASGHPSALLVTGHRDGRLRVWDATAQVPSLLMVVPSSTGAERLKAVTAIAVCPFSGILAAGHVGGEVRVYQFTDSAQHVHRHNVDETKFAYSNVSPQVGRNVCV
jgi:hypothetical protein